MRSTFQTFKDENGVSKLEKGIIVKYIIRILQKGMKKNQTYLNIKQNDIIYASGYNAILHDLLFKLN